MSKANFSIQMYTQEQFPNKHHSALEELRVCKEKLRMHKEKEKLSEERTAKLHQQVVDLTSKNKNLLEKVRSHENYKAIECQDNADNVRMPH